MAGLLLYNVRSLYKQLLRIRGFWPVMGEGKIEEGRFGGIFWAQGKQKIANWLGDEREGLEEQEWWARERLKREGLKGFLSLT